MQTFLLKKRIAGGSHLLKSLNDLPFLSFSSLRNVTPFIGVCSSSPVFEGSPPRMCSPWMAAARCLRGAGTAAKASLIHLGTTAFVSDNLLDFSRIPAWGKLWHFVLCWELCGHLPRSSFWVLWSSRRDVVQQLPTGENQHSKQSREESMCLFLKEKSSVSAGLSLQLVCGNFPFLLHFSGRQQGPEI